MNPTRILVCTALALAAGCAPFAVTTPDGMIALNEPSWSVYDYRATTPEGVVVAARQIRMRAKGDTPPAELDFWVDATILRLRTTAAYALIDREPTRSADGTEGVLLRFGRDHDGGIYRYDLALFCTKRFVHVVEAGGPEELFEQASDSIDVAFGSYTVRR